MSSLLNQCLGLLSQLMNMWYESKFVIFADIIHQMHYKMMVKYKLIWPKELIEMKKNKK